MTDWYERALARIPGGVNSPVRSFASVGGQPFFTERGDGAYLIDTEGNRYVDYVQSWGASILGHAHPAVVEAVQRAAAAGTSYGTPTRGEVELAEAVCERVPSVEKLRLVSSGTEAAMTAVRLARGATGRSKIVKFAGCYHGHLDALLVAAGSGVATLGLPGSAGVTAGATADTIVVPYNDLDALDAVLSSLGPELAAVMVEPVAANMGLVAPEPGFLEGLRARCDAVGALLVFDEVITGFRLGPAGAQGHFGVRPDLSIFGKVLGGGLPLAALGGPASLMDELAPLGAVYQAGTLSGNPLATAAGLAVLALLDQAAYAELEVKAKRLEATLRDACAATSLPARVTRVATLVGLFFTAQKVVDYEGARAADHERYARCFHGLLDRGVFFAPSGYETLFVSLAHDDAAADATTAAMMEAVALIAAIE
jgi:glutamate-1-semialdehyde 2,1-aminomutase